MAKTAKQEIAYHVKSAKKWTKIYLEDINEYIAEGDLKGAEYAAAQLAPLWGSIEMLIQDLRKAAKVGA